MKTEAYISRVKWIVNSAIEHNEQFAKRLIYTPYGLRARTDNVFVAMAISQISRSKSDVV